MKPLGLAATGFFIVEVLHTFLASGQPLRTRSAPCVREASTCTEGPGVTERRALINGLNAIKKVLVRRLHQFKLHACKSDCSMI